MPSDHNVFFQLNNNEACRCRLAELHDATSTGNVSGQKRCGPLGRLVSRPEVTIRPLFAAERSSAPSAMQCLLQELQGRSTEGDVDRSLAGYGEIRFSSVDEAKRACRALQQDSLIRSAHVGVVKELAGSAGDPLRDQQWALDRIGLTSEVQFAATHDVQVAIIDTGVDREHPDLLGTPIEELVFNGRSRRDVDAHGTHVAGIIAAVIGNGLGIAGMCRPSVMLSFKALSPFSEAGYYRALREAIRRRVDVLNLSLTGEASPTEANLLRTAIRRGTVVVAAMGNHGRKRRCFPAAYPQVIAVGASSQADQHWSRSNWGRHIDLVAPGEMILSTVPRYRTRRSRRTHYDEGWNGTSQAAAFVTGAVALCRAISADLDPRTVRDLLRGNADVLEEQRGFTYRLGWGRLNAARTLHAASNMKIARVRQ